MNIETCFPSEYVKAGDLNGRVTVKIHHVEMRVVGDDSKPVVFFEKTQKGLVLNKTNARSIIQIAGGVTDTDQWTGIQVVIYPTTTDYSGQRVPCIRIDAPTLGTVTPTDNVKTPAPPVVGEDEIPF